MKQVSLVTCYNHAGELLLGKRKDCGLLTLPGGSLNEGESPEDGARRELLEETALNALTLSPVTVHTLPNGTVLHCFSAYVGTQIPHGENDPDQEVATEDWKFHDISEGLPTAVAKKLYGPKNVDDNLVLRLFNIQQKDEPVAKAESDDEITRLLQHPNPAERSMALKLEGVTPAHLGLAANDPDPTVHLPAVKHPLFDSDTALQIMQVAGNAAAKKACLDRHDILQTQHLIALYQSDPDFDAFHSALVNHPVMDADLVRIIYNDPKVLFENRLALMVHPAVPADVIESVVQTAMTVPGMAVDLAQFAIMHPNCPPPLAEQVVRTAIGSKQPHQLVLADFILRNKPVAPKFIDEILGLAQIRSDLHPLCDAVLTNPVANPAQRHWYLSKLMQHRIEPDALHKSEVAVPNQEQTALHMLGHRPKVLDAFQAGAFLSGKPPLTPEAVRLALYAHEHDLQAAVLTAYGYEPTKENRAALAAVCGLGAMQKAEPTPLDAETVFAPHPEGKEVADSVRRAFQDQQTFTIKLGGRHSAGSLLARDQETGSTWLLKPGAGNQSSAAGANDDPATQSDREAAWYQVAKLWNLDKWFTETHLLRIDGKEYAAMRLVPWSYQALQDRNDKEPATGRTVMQPLLQDGTLHRLAMLDAVAGNGDRHGSNVLVNDSGEVKLIDHGSAFAGVHFDPAFDKNSYTPAYLRAWAPANFNQLTPEKKLAVLPRVSRQTDGELTGWVNNLDANRLKSVLVSYGIDPGPSLARLQEIKDSVTANRVDDAINRFWVTV